MSSNHFSAHSSVDLASLASAEMTEEGFELKHQKAEAQQLAAIVAACHDDDCRDVDNDSSRRDLLSLPWSSIDNDSSRDLDQIEWAERVEGSDGIRVRIAIADVTATIPKGSPIDHFAQQQCQTVYTAARNFPMLPVELSTGLTSLNPGEERNAVVSEFIVREDGSLINRTIFAARVQNRAQMAYSRVGPFLASGEQNPPMTPAGDLLLNATPEMQDQLRLQDEAAQRIRKFRKANGALDFRRAEANPVVADGKVLTLEDGGRNRAMDLIEDLMIAANETVALALAEAKRSCLRRIVKSPQRWERIVDLVYAASENLPQRVKLPNEPDSKALNDFLCRERERDPDHYPDLSLSIIKLMGPGEYVLSSGNDPNPPGHFALAAGDYSHSTAPNRRFADLVTQRIVHAMLDNAPAPYSDDELSAIADHCNERDRAATHVERAMRKRGWALALSHNIGQHFRAIVTGTGRKGTFVRILKPAVEGMLVHGGEGLDIGDRINVTLVHTDVNHAFIDFVRVGS